MKKALFALFAMLLVQLSIPVWAQPKHTFEIGEKAFLLDGKPIQFFCGEIHPYRVPAEYWKDRLQMIRAMGMNSISIYMFWNVHEPQKGKYNFSGSADIARFVKLAQEAGLWVILRPSPYACAEWEFGGYPWWLLKEKDVKVRSKDPRFIEVYKNYIAQVAEHLAPLQVQNGGPILMVQIENEYGFYGNDKEYLALNRDIFKNAGFTCNLFTCDPPYVIDNGHLPGTYAAVNGGMKSKAIIETQNRINGKAPYFVSEWYPAWFDVWGKKHHTASPESMVAHLDTIFKQGISLNMYMAHGGSNFGFMNGSNYDTNLPFQAQTQSYDYDAPINEAGNATPKYYVYRKMVEKYYPAGATIPAVPEPKPSMSIPTFTLNEVSTLEANRPKVITSDMPLSFEDINQGYGYVLYESKLPEGKGWLKVKELRDYAIVMLDGKRLGVLNRSFKRDSIWVETTKPNQTISIFVENLGRINFGTFLNDNRKGITKEVTFAGNTVRGWNIYGYPFTRVDNIKFRAAKASDKFEGPVVRRGTFTLDKVADTYLNVGSFGKGSVWVNGHHVGRYWSIGPQQTLYIPAPWLKKGKNTVVVFELLKMTEDKLSAIDHPILDDVRQEMFVGPTTGQQIIE